MRKITVITCICLFVAILVSFFLNWKYEIVAINPFFGDNNYELKVLTWNVCCSEGADSNRQIKIANIILQEDADFVLLNEYYQDSCLVIDSLLKRKYPFTEEYQSHRICGDIFYSKRTMKNSGHVFIPLDGEAIRTIKATIAVGKDSVAIFGLHMASNNYDICTIDEIDSENDNNSRYERYKKAQKYRCFQAEWTKYAVLNSQHPVIVMGDMNDINGSSSLNIFKNSGLLDTWWEGGFGYGATFHEGWLRLRIDHIYYNDKLKLKDVKVVETDLSDHNILVASFVFAN